MNHPIEKRIEQVRNALPKHNIDTLLILIEENRRYLSGFEGEDTQFDESAGALFISQDHLVLATDSRYELEAQRDAPLYKVVCYQEGLDKEMGNILDSLGTQRLGFESIRISFSQHEKIAEAVRSSGLGVALVPTADIVEGFRVQKDEAEIEATKKALALSEQVFLSVAKSLTIGMTEKQAAWAMEKGMREGGAQAMAFPTIVASGPNSALPHAVPGDRAFKTGEPILFDWGAKLDGYCSDTTRTVVLGQPDATFKKVYQTVLDAQQKAMDAIKTGANTAAVDRLARSHIENAGFTGRFGHGLGHGTGLAVHEAPRLSPIRNTRLEEGMIVTVEPGIYLPDWGGIRIENQVVVRDDGPEVLTQLNRCYTIDEL